MMIIRLKHIRDVYNQLGLYIYRYKCIACAAFRGYCQLYLKCTCIGIAMPGISQIRSIVRRIIPEGPLVSGAWVVEVYAAAARVKGKLHLWQRDSGELRVGGYHRPGSCISRYPVCLYKGAGTTRVRYFCQCDTELLGVFAIGYFIYMEWVGVLRMCAPVPEVPVVCFDNAAVGYTLYR